jgi:hypothetical protein
MSDRNPPDPPQVELSRPRRRSWGQREVAAIVEDWAAKKSDFAMLANELAATPLPSTAGPKVRALMTTADLGKPYDQEDNLMSAFQDAYEELHPTQGGSRRARRTRRTRRTRKAMRGRGLLDAFKKPTKTMEQVENEMYAKANTMNTVKTGVFDTLTAKLPQTPEAYRNFVTTAQTARTANAARKTAGRRRLTRRRR